ncbi:hypothetical protein Pfo_029168 [Paulownia fortunei]|nr:hypothetical protein Pfo_029168 [Paulownia fortunei]
MSDLYGSNESEDMSSFLQILLQNSSSSAATTDSTTASAAAGGLFSGGGAVAESSTSINFSDPSCFFARESDGMNSSSRVKNLASSCERSRAAQVHNLSEKRRRSRINEKLKALQNLIPNSNKTDKASMLDEAIEYLKQLQLQVQMLTMRNGLSLHPATHWDRCSTDTLSRDQDVFMQSALVPTNHSSSTMPMLIPSTANAANSGILPSFVPSTQNRYGLLNNLASAKVILCSGNNSSPGVSS